MTFKFIGEHKVKNIKQPVRVYHTLTDPAFSGKIIGEAEGDRSIMPKTILAVTVVILLVAAAYLYIANKPTQEISKKEPERPSIAVLPFSNMSDDPQQEYFSDGMTDDLVTDLSKVSGLIVISRNSTFTYKGQPVQIKSVAQELGVKYVLEGSVRKFGDQIRINAQLIDAERDHHVWAESYDGQMKEHFKPKVEVSVKKPAHLQLKMNFLLLIYQKIQRDLITRVLCLKTEMVQRISLMSTYLLRFGL